MFQVIKNPKNSAMWSGNKAIVPLSKTGNENKTSESDRFFDFDAVDLDHARIGVRLNVVPTVSLFLQKLEGGHLEMSSLVPRPSHCLSFSSFVVCKTGLVHFIT